LANLRRDAFLDEDANHIVELCLFKSQLIFDQLSAVRTTTSKYKLAQRYTEYFTYPDFEVENAGPAVDYKVVGVYLLLTIKHLLRC
jgi:hypothetical protein